MNTSFILTQRIGKTPKLKLLPLLSRITLARFSTSPPGPIDLPSRTSQLASLSSSKTPYDVLIIGGGATGAGAAFDAASRGLSVACIERGDFASETSSRSTKLIWAGIRYLATAAAGLLRPASLTNPVGAVKDFWGEFKMVLNCHRERKYMLEKNGHLTNWVPIAIPFDSWYVTPAPFGHWLFSFFPILAPATLKFYDSLSGFTCPPSYSMGKRASKEAFPQLSDRDIKYCAVFYEGQHNDARTNLAIAMSAAEHGAHIANYTEMVGVVREEGGKKALGVTAKDVTDPDGPEFEIRANKIIFAGGPFTDSLREMEAPEGEEVKPVVNGASGSHVVLPGYYCPNKMGLLDYNTSDGRFLFFLPWQGHTLVGTTDTKCKAQSLPTAPEDEIQWLLNECGKYLSKNLRVRRSDVLSAWRGWRPLAVDPHAPPGAPVSRDHVISENPESGILFIAGGKWTTWREMAEEVIDRVTDKPCKTLEIPLFGGDGWQPELSVELIQEHDITQDTAEHLSKTYGTRAWEVCQFAKPTHLPWPRFGNAIAQNYPYIEAEVTYACREYACTIEDVLCRRTRLAFLNKDAALGALPVVADIMAREMGWSPQQKNIQMERALTHLEAFGGRIPDKKGSELRGATYTDFEDIFNAIDTDNSGYLDQMEVADVAKTLGFPLNKEDLVLAMHEMDENGDGKVSKEEFDNWWNNSKDSELQKKLAKELGFVIATTEDLKNVGSGVFLG